MKDFARAKRHIDISTGESVRMLRELQEQSQNQLVDLCGIPQSTIFAIEDDRVRLGVERSQTLARALQPSCRIGFCRLGCGSRVCCLANHHAITTGSHMPEALNFKPPQSRVNQSTRPICSSSSTKRGSSRMKS